jgi:hypothetical protein
VFAKKPAFWVTYEPNLKNTSTHVTCGSIANHWPNNIVIHLDYQQTSKRLSGKGNISITAIFMLKLKSFYGELFDAKLSSADLKITVI